MEASRDRTSRTDVADRVGGGPVDGTPELNVYGLHSGRTVVTEPGNTDGWIATDLTVTPRE